MTAPAVCLFPLSSKLCGVSRAPIRPALPARPAPPAAARSYLLPFTPGDYVFVVHHVISSVYIVG